MAYRGLTGGGDAIDDDPPGAEEDKPRRYTHGCRAAGSDAGDASRAFDVPPRARLDAGASFGVPKPSGEARVRFTGVLNAVRDGVRVAGGVVSSAGDSLELVRGCFDVAGARFNLTEGCFDLTGGCLEVAGDGEVLTGCFAMVVGFGIVGEAFGYDDEAATSDDFRWPLDLSTVRSKNFGASG
ncbi:RNA-directed RNA polymerase L [Striga asiatica]|uniref:RNA-directed RNA polymerase L n=1 Tax=Striga asiatica TaxID=4170 RepID=A0A5A7P660_STRAF|nr:RNA-directed RNA polymerase L [Striga asiatica]